MKKDYDVIVVGAGPAGCSAAAFIAKEGYDVLLVDKAFFPRDKTCGDAVNAPAFHVLERMGVMGLVDDTNPWKSEGVLVSAPNGLAMSSRNPHVEGQRDYSYVYPRKDFDNLLFQFTKKLSNVDVLQGFNVTGLLYDGQRVCGVKNKKGEAYCGKIIIGADGVHSVLAKELSLLNEAPKHRAFAMRAYFENVEGLGNFLELHYEQSILPGYAWIFATGENTANIGAGVGTRFTEVTDMKTMYYRFLENNPFATERLKNAKMVKGSLKGAWIPFGSFPKRRYKENVLLIGDAASFVDTLTGEGIYYALQSGEYAARAVCQGLASNDVDDAGRTYERLWRADFKRKEFSYGYTLQYFLSKPRLVDFIIGRAARKPKVAETLSGVIVHKLPKSKLFFNF